MVLLVVHHPEPHAFQFHVRYAEDFLVLLLFVLVGVPEVEDAFQVSAG